MDTVYHGYSHLLENMPAVGYDVEMQDSEKVLKNILVIGFGGTIAMIPDAEGILKPARSVSDILAAVPEISQKCNLSFIELENKDSTNINPTHWKKLILKIEEVIRSGEVEGILVTHGTDTMSYTASAVSIAFGRSLPIPVIFTGSQLPLVSFGTDARFNLENSIKVVIEAANKEIAEVMIVFGDKILRGNRSIKVSEAKFLAFDTPAIEPLGWIDALGIHFNPNISLRTSGVGLTVKPDFSSDILSVDVSPGLQPSLLKNLILSGLCKGILFKSLGAGNVPSEGDFSLMPVIELAIKNNIPVLITTKFVGGHTHMDIYEPGSLALRKGAISCGDMTDVMSQVKFMWILGQGYSSIGDIEKAVIKNFAGEISSA